MVARIVIIFIHDIGTVFVISVVFMRSQSQDSYSAEEKVLKRLFS